MKSLSLSRPVVILMIGAPGSGKSFFARQFADMFSSPIVSYDQIRNELFQESNFTPDEERIVDRVAGMFQEQLFKTNRSFIIDGGMNGRTDRYDLSRIAKKHGFETLIIWVQIDQPTSQSRSQKRVANRKYDEYNQSLNEEQYVRLVKAFTPPLQRENVLVISGKHTFATQARMVLKRLAPSRETAPSNDPRSTVRPTTPEQNRPRRLSIQ